MGMGQFEDNWKERSIPGCGPSSGPAKKFQFEDLQQGKGNPSVEGKKASSNYGFFGGSRVKKKTKRNCQQNAWKENLLKNR